VLILITYESKKLDGLTFFNVMRKDCIDFSLLCTTEQKPNYSIYCTTFVVENERQSS
jgi:hypothetical protein